MTKKRRKGGGVGARKADRMRSRTHKRGRTPGWALRELAASIEEWRALTPGEALYRARRLGLVGPLPSDAREAALVLGSQPAAVPVVRPPAGRH